MVRELTPERRWGRDRQLAPKVESDEDGTKGEEEEGRKGTNLEPLVLENLLDGNIVTRFRLRDELCLEDDTEGAISDDLTVGVGDVRVLASLSVGCDDFDDLPRVVDGCTI